MPYFSVEYSGLYCKLFSRNKKFKISVKKFFRFGNFADFDIKIVP